MIYLFKIDVVFESKKLKSQFGDKIPLNEYAGLIIDKSECSLYKKMILEECDKRFGKKFDDKNDLRKSNYEVFFTVKE